MSILVVSVNHKTAEMADLSRVALDTSAAGKLASSVLASEYVDESIVLSTCNRTEVYASVTRFHGALDVVTSALSEVSGVGVVELQERCAVYFDEGAVAHTFSVAAGLDSLVVGENQILGQVRTALASAQAHESAGTVLNALFQRALRVGKRVQAETAVGSAGRSLVSAAYEVLTGEIGPLTGRRVVVIGAGAMASLAARTAAAVGADVVCVNRTRSRAERLAEAIGGRAAGLGQLRAEVAQAEVLISCTGGADLHLGVEDLRGSALLGVVDLALPADVSEAVRELGVCLVNLRSLMADQPGGAGQTEIEAARDLVGVEVADFLGIRRAASVAPTVVALRSMASEVVDAELARLDARLPELGAQDRLEVQRTVRRVVEKLLHQPTVRVQELAAGSDSVDYAAALRELFALDPQAVAAVITPETSR